MFFAILKRFVSAPKRIIFFLRNLDANRIRTYLSSYEIFLPVSDRRWAIAQKAEAESWHLPLNVKGEEEIEILLGDERKKAKFLVSVAEKNLGIRVDKFVDGKIVIDVACGPGSIMADLENPKAKYGIDPANFPSWVTERYASFGFRLIQAPLESAHLQDFKYEKELVVVLYNALQHFQNCAVALNNLYSNLGNHHLFFVDYGYIPADKAHPQILTYMRLKKLLIESGYVIEKMAQSEERLPGLVEIGSGFPTTIISGLAKKML